MSITSIKWGEDRIPFHLRHLGLKVCEEMKSDMSRQFLLPSDLELRLRTTGEAKTAGKGLWDVTLDCSGGKQSSCLQMWGDGLAAWGQRAPHPSVCCLSLMVVSLWLRVKKWHGGEVGWWKRALSFEPPLRTCLGGFPFQTSCQKKKKKLLCVKEQASGCDWHVTVGGAKPTTGVTHAGFLSPQPVCLENPSGGGLVVIFFFSFTYQDAHWNKWWTLMGPATAGRCSLSEQQSSLEWASGLPPQWWFPGGWSERPLERKRIGDSQAGTGHIPPELRQGLRLLHHLVI